MTVPTVVDPMGDEPPEGTAEDIAELSDEVWTDETRTPVPAEHVALIADVLEVEELAGRILDVCYRKSTPYERLDVIIGLCQSVLNAGDDDA